MAAADVIKARMDVIGQWKKIKRYAEWHKE